VTTCRKDSGRFPRRFYLDVLRFLATVVMDFTPSSALRRPVIYGTNSFCFCPLGSLGNKQAINRKRSPMQQKPPWSRTTMDFSRSKSGTSLLLCIKKDQSFWLYVLIPRECQYVLMQIPEIDGSTCEISHSFARLNSECLKPPQQRHCSTKINHYISPWQPICALPTRCSLPQDNEGY
jgi:hypothetical protein